MTRLTTLLSAFAFCAALTLSAPAQACHCNGDKGATADTKGECPHAKDGKAKCEEHAKAGDCKCGKVGADCKCGGDCKCGEGECGEGECGCKKDDAKAVDTKKTEPAKADAKKVEPKKADAKK